MKVVNFKPKLLRAFVVGMAVSVLSSCATQNMNQASSDSILSRDVAGKNSITEEIRGVHLDPLIFGEATKDRLNVLNSLNRKKPGKIKGTIEGKGSYSKIFCGRIYDFVDDIDKYEEGIIDYHVVNLDCRNTTIENGSNFRTSQKFAWVKRADLTPARKAMFTRFKKLAIKRAGEDQKQDRRMSFRAANPYSCFDAEFIGNDPCTTNSTDVWVGKINKMTMSKNIHE